ncbi:reverse transcriptase domain-containing protein [Tanacetum coccineum]
MHETGQCTIAPSNTPRGTGKQFKSKVRNSRNKAVVAKVSSNSSTPGISPDVAAFTTEVSELKNMMKTMLIDKQKAQAPAPVKAVEQSCVTCGVNAITTRSGKTCEGPSTPLVPTPVVSTPLKEPEQNPETSMEKVQNPIPEKLEDPGNFLIPCALQELDKTNALADSGASINLLPHSIYKQLGLGALKPTRITLELANRSG